MMKSSLILILLAARALAETPGDSALQGLQEWLKKPTESRPVLADAAFAKAELTRDQAKAAADLLWTDHAARIRAERAAEMKAGEIKIGDKTMKLLTARFGPEKAPPGGRSLFLSMHGGGNAPPQLNDQQWQNQLALAKGYAPAEGIYIAPRAPTNTWNLWHEAHIDRMFARLVENLIVLEEVNPDRVYVMGYSAGGDGTYQLAPRMSDWWAAAAMSAGHPNETKPEGLRNVPFALQAGGRDAAFNRNKICTEWGEKLDALQKADPGGYDHLVKLHEGKPHWMGLEDRIAIPWMEKHTRNPLPERLVWLQDDITHDRHYWLAVPAGTAKGGVQITAERKGQAISLTAPAGTKVTVLLNDALLDLDQPVEIAAAGKKLFSGKVQRRAATLARTLEERGDPKLTFSAEVTVETQP